MKSEEKKIYVYDDFLNDRPQLMGLIYVNSMRGNETYSFEYEEEWLKKYGLTMNIDPQIYPYKGRQYTSTGNMFGAFADSSPDRWGRVLMKKKERIRAEKEGRKPQKLQDSDFLLGVYDETRMGGLRFKIDEEGSFVSDDAESSIPPWTSLRTLEEASRQLEQENNIFEEKWLNQLIMPGSSLGGARPKATIKDENGELWIAKFPSKHDENNTGAWEKVVSDLARASGLNVPETRVEEFSKQGSTFLVKRFDREKGKRKHFTSAMTLLGKTDGASAADGTGYLDIAAFIKANSVKPKEDLEELWMRIVFNMAVSNTDDHLRNHAFILAGEGWSLSPLYDVNPIPYGEELAINVNEADNRISIKLAVETAEFFGIERSRAEYLAESITSTVRENWEKKAVQYGITRSQIEKMKPAFSECYE